MPTVYNSQSTTSSADLQHHPPARYSNRFSTDADIYHDLTHTHDDVGLYNASGNQNYDNVRITDEDPQLCQTQQDDTHQDVIISNEEASLMPTPPFDPDGNEYQSDDENSLENDPDRNRLFGLIEDLFDYRSKHVL